MTTIPKAPACSCTPVEFHDVPMTVCEAWAMIGLALHIPAHEFVEPKSVPVEWLHHMMTMAYRATQYVPDEPGSDDMERWRDEIQSRLDVLPPLPGKETLN